MSSGVFTVIAVAFPELPSEIRLAISEYLYPPHMCGKVRSAAYDGNKYIVERFWPVCMNAYLAMTTAVICGHVKLVQTLHNEFGVMYCPRFFVARAIIDDKLDVIEYLYKNNMMDCSSGYDGPTLNFEVESDIPATVLFLKSHNLLNRYRTSLYIKHNRVAALAWLHKNDLAN